MFVGINFLPTLCCLQPLFDLLNKICYLKDYLDPSDNRMIDLSRTDWGTTLPPIKKLKRRCTDTGVIVVVVRKLMKGKVGAPITTEIYDTSSQHILKHLDGSLSMFVNLRMISSAKVQPHTQFLMEPLPKLISEPNMSIRYVTPCSELFHNLGS